MKLYPLNNIFLICLAHGKGFTNQGKRANTVLPEFVYPTGTCDAETFAHVRSRPEV